ncbi:8556_t:CDS:2, partial [Gigaspora rosea]
MKTSVFYPVDPFFLPGDLTGNILDSWPISFLPELFRLRDYHRIRLFDSTTTTTQESLTDENTGIRQKANKPLLETPTRPILESTTNEIETGSSQMADNQNTSKAP